MLKRKESGDDEPEIPDAIGLTREQQQAIPEGRSAIERRICALRGAEILQRPQVVEQIAKCEQQLEELKRDFKLLHREKAARALQVANDFNAAVMSMDAKHRFIPPPQPHAMGGVAVVVIDGAFPTTTASLF